MELPQVFKRLRISCLVHAPDFQQNDVYVYWVVRSFKTETAGTSKMDVNLIIIESVKPKQLTLFKSVEK